jgi:hypothetical protein
VVSWVVLVFFAGSADRVFVTFGLSYTGQIWTYRILVLVLPVLFGLVAWWICKELQRSERVVQERHEAEVEARAARLSRL